MAEKPNKWSRDQGFFAANTGDIFTIAVVALCGALFFILLFTQWNMESLVQGFFQEQAASLPPEPPRQPDIPSKPGETGMYLYPSQPAPAPPKPAGQKPKK